MKEFAGDSPANPLRFHRQDARVVIMAICGVFALVSLVTCGAVVMAMAAMFNALWLGRWMESSAGLRGIATFVAAILCFLLAAFVAVADLLTLLSMGQILPFFSRLAQLFSSF